MNVFVRQVEKRKKCGLGSTNFRIIIIVITPQLTFNAIDETD